MARPNLTEADLRRVHSGMGLPPYESLSTLQRALVRAVAGAKPRRLEIKTRPVSMDFKRRAAGDLDD